MRERRREVRGSIVDDAWEADEKLRTKVKDSFRGRKNVLLYLCLYRNGKVKVNDYDACG